jgi:hypothetical protein
MRLGPEIAGTTTGRQGGRQGDENCLRGFRNHIGYSKKEHTTVEAMTPVEG